MTDKIYIQENGKKREAKGDELQYILSWQKEIEDNQRLIEAAEKEKIEKRESAVGKLKSLGLTDDEVEALLG
jgi:hypothetical protein